MNMLRYFLLCLVFVSFTSVAQEDLEFTVVPGNLPGWKQGYAKDFGTGKGTIKEYVLEGQSVNNWNELVTIQFFEGSKDTPAAAVSKWRQLKSCERGQKTIKILHQDKYSVVTLMTAKNCKEAPDQQEIARLMMGKGNWKNKIILNH